MLILTITLSLFSWVLYYNFRHSLHENLNDLLMSKAEGIADSIDTYWEAEKLEAIKGGVTTNVFSKINNINFAKIAQQWVEEKSTDPKLINIAVWVYDANGEPIASSKDIPNFKVLSRGMFGDVLRGHSRFDNFDIEIITGKPTTFRVFTAPIIEDKKVSYIVQVASPLTILYAELTKLRGILFLVLPITIFFTGIAGALLAKMTLNPINSMIRTTRQIRADNLNLRITIPDTKDEIKRLADTFNEMLEELDRAFTFQRQFIQNVSHELKTPLTILKGEIEVTLKKIRSANEYEAVLRSSSEEIEKISQMVEELLLLAKFDSRQMILEMKEVDLSEFIQNIVENIRVLAEAKNLKITFFCQRQIIIAADENQMKRLFLNLLDNSIKYTPEGGKVMIDLQKKEEIVNVHIADTGIGIPKEELPFIFDRFYQVDKSRTGMGVGLGLSIAKSIVEAHRGTIQVESKLGQGTTFVVTLPLSVNSNLHLPQFVLQK